MSTTPRPPQRGDDTDFAQEHARPAPPIAPSPNTPLEGLDPDRAGWGRPANHPPAWQQVKAWFRKLTHRVP
ncbi:MAG: hypothetical protein IPJ65_24245 [Archangiaceae bacterium]|nr:hypothetical protein [Archangiaceae bacterium]